MLEKRPGDEYQDWEYPDPRTWKSWMSFLKTMTRSRGEGLASQASARHYRNRSPDLRRVSSPAVLAGAGARPRRRGAG